MKTTLATLATSIAAYIDGRGQYNGVYEVSVDGIMAVVDYSAELGYDGGDYWTAPCGWTEAERFEVVELYDELTGEDVEGREELNRMLNK